MTALNEQNILERVASEKRTESQDPLAKGIRIDLVKLAAKAAATVTIGAATFAGAVTGVQYVPNSEIVLSATEPRTLTVINRGSAGVGSAVVATRSFTSTGSAQIGNAITLTGSAVSVNAGDVLVVESHDAGATGTADPGGTLVVTTSKVVKTASGVANEGTGYVGALTSGQ